MINMKASPGKHHVVALVRNKDGQPQFNDFTDIPEVFHGSLTEEDWIYINERREQHVANSLSSA